MSNKKYLFTLLLLIPTISLSKIKDKTFRNIVALRNVLANSINVNTDMTINRNLNVIGNTRTSNLTVNDSLIVQGDLSIPTIGGTAGVVQSDTNGKLTSSPNVQLDSITKSGNTVLWPTGVGATGTVLTIISSGQLGYASGSTGSGNVTTSSDFSASNKILVTTAPATKDIKPSVVLLDPITGDISGVNTLTATTFIGNLTGHLTGSVTGDLLGTVTGHATLDLPLTGGTMSGSINMGNYNITNANIITTTNIDLQPGSAVAPAITFAGGTGYGIYSPTGGEVAIASDGIEMLKTNTSGTTINRNAYLNCATRFTGPNGLEPLDLSLITSTTINLSAYPNISVFLLSNPSADPATFTITFDTGDETGRIITFVQKDDLNVNNTIDIVGYVLTSLKHSPISLIPTDGVTGYSGATIMCIGDGSWTPISGYRVLG